MKSPPFCPNPDCPNYFGPVQNWFIRKGTYPTNRSGPVQRFRCRHCGQSFSSSTFSLDYGVKKIVPYKPIMDHLVTSSGIRDISRCLKISCSTVTNRISRLARQAVAIQAELTKDLKIKEDLVADGFESFTYSQYFPNNIQILVGKESQFWFFSDYAHISRKGRMTMRQKKINEEIKKNLKPDRTTVYESFEILMQEVRKLLERSDLKNVELHTDEHKQYQAVIKNECSGLPLRHITTNSKEPRSIQNDLYAANYLDRLIRKDNSDHVRETQQSAKNACNAMERLVISRFHHNFRKSYRINGSQWQDVTHAMAIYTFRHWSGSNDDASRLISAFS